MKKMIVITVEALSDQTDELERIEGIETTTMLLHYEGEGFVTDELLASEVADISDKIAEAVKL